MALLSRLMQHPDMVQPRANLIEQVWAGADISDRTLDSHLRNLRRKLAEAGCPDAIQTLHGIGIRMGPCMTRRLHRFTNIHLGGPMTPPKWRPALWMVLGGALLATLALSFAGLIALRYLGPEFGFRRAAVALALLIGAATLVLGVLLVRLLLRPVTTLSEQAARPAPQPRPRPSPPCRTTAPANCATSPTASPPWPPPCKTARRRSAASPTM